MALGQVEKLFAVCLGKEKEGPCLIGLRQDNLNCLVKLANLGLVR
jgi:hypothetical protein